MSAELETVLWITVVGSTMLFASIAGLVGLMYLLTATWLFPKGERKTWRSQWRITRGKGRRRRDKRRARIPDGPAPELEVEVDDLEHERRLRAVALAAATAFAETETVRVHPLGFSPDWRFVNRARQLGRLPPRRKAPR